MRMAELGIEEKEDEEKWSEEGAGLWVKWLMGTQEKIEWKGQNAKMALFGLDGTDTDIAKRWLDGE